jgi:hypothetical protein
MKALNDDERYSLARFLDYLRDQPPAYSSGTTDRLRLQVEWLAWALRAGDLVVPSEIERHPNGEFVLRGQQDRSDRSTIERAQTQKILDGIEAEFEAAWRAACDPNLPRSPYDFASALVKKVSGNTGDGT